MLIQHWLVSIMACTALAWGIESVAQEPSADQVARRLAQVSTLVETSSGAKQVAAASNEAAAAKREAARGMYKLAAAAYERNDLKSATQLLDEATRMMMDAVRLASPQQVSQPKEQRDFTARRESVVALIGAEKRISKDKVAGVAPANAGQQAERLLSQADGLAAQGKWTEARRDLDAAYLSIKATVRGMRQGDTLVRSLSFATKEEEYHYEVDRNDTHLMLLRVLLQDKVPPAGHATLLEEAARLRRTAEDAAARRDFDSGVRGLEDSTRELVRAIRGAGVYIPG